MMLHKLKMSLKKSKAGYYARNLLRQVVPVTLYQLRLHQKLAGIKNFDRDYLAYRVNYYNKLNNFTTPGPNAIPLKGMQIFKSPKTYNFDTFEYTRYFNKHLKATFIFGDAIHVAGEPSIQKSRPIAADNHNAILLKLDKKRHFVFVKDRVKFADKKNMLIGRGMMSQPHRIKFMDMYFNDPLCNLGHVNKTGGKLEWVKPKISITAHLQYKFILSLEGNDVATNLKWIMSSNSIAVMPRPKYETWFMEGRLIGGQHYIEIADDYSDLHQKLEYYINNTAEAEIIINNANAFVRQFMDKKREDLISLLVLQKYFYYTGQLEQKPVLL